ncbi:MAG: hypothetical protein HUJ56_04765, partial [Erysipelotrichaceae bacterium]|nr:hypothetical protein [Erysipelotrichaceae bacterium]
MDSYNYSTYYKGTPKKLSECEYIYLFSSIDPVFSGLPLDLEHLDDIKKAVLENLDKTRKNNKKVDNVYYIDREPEDTRLFEFDMILYCTEELEMVAENPIVGFTRFSSQQRTYSSSGIPFDELRISITFTGSEYEFVPEIILKNTLKTTQSEQPIDGPEDYNYPIINKDGKDPFKGIPGPEEGYLKFTGKVSDFSGDSDLGILTESTLIYHSQDSIPGAGSFFINSGLSLDLEIFSMVKVGIYNGDVVCLRVSLGTGEYSISSLTRVNKFRQPYVYITGYLNLTALVGYDFVAYNGSTMLYRNQASGDYLVYHLVEGKYSIYPKSMQDRPGVKHVVLDQWDINGGFRYLEEGDIYKEVYRTCFTPGDFVLSDNKYKKKDDPIFSTNLYLYKKKIGSWWVFT